jgi:hypothetical protein
MWESYQTTVRQSYYLLLVAITSEFLYQYNLPSQKVNRFVSHLEPQSGPLYRLRRNSH